MTLFGVASFKLCNGLMSGGGADGGVGTAVFPSLRLGSGVLVVVLVVALTDALNVLVVDAVAELDIVEVVTVGFSSFGFKDGTDEKYDICVPKSGGMLSLGRYNRWGK
jgi:hypothetical protein